MGAIGLGQEGWVKVQGHRLVVNNQPWYFIGTNMWYAGLLGTGDGVKGKQRLEHELDFLKRKGITNIRVVLGAEGDGGLVSGVKPIHPGIQPEQGRFDEKVFYGVDFLLQALGKRKMNAVFFFSNNWEWSGGFLQYLAWNGKIDKDSVAKKLSWDDYRDQVSRFYSCDGCMEAYWAYVRKVLQRTNSITRRKYADDPAVMAWEVANEPRPMRPYAMPAYEAFLRKTTALIKSIDKRHLVTLGAEGDIGTESPEAYERIHRDKNVDYLTIHIWPKNWGWFQGSAIAEGIDSVIIKGRDFIDRHAAIATRIGKPLVVEEFGLPRDGHSFDTGATTMYRDKWFEAVFARWKESRQKGGALAGASFWAFGGEGRPVPGQVYWKEGDALLGDPPMEEQGLNAVFDSDGSTWKVIESFIQPIHSAHGTMGRQ
jgi:mannan endo-1,4-beta-mannosidase